MIDFKYYGHPPLVKTILVACFIKKYVEVKNKYITLLTESYSQNLEKTLNWVFINNLRTFPNQIVKYTWKKKTSQNNQLDLSYKIKIITL